jgi:hypothetical protein
MIKEFSVDFDLKECCEALRVSRSGYYRWRRAQPSRREKENAELVEQIREVFEANKSRLRQSPRDQGVAPAGPEVRAEPHSALDAGK